METFSSSPASCSLHAGVIPERMMPTVKNARCNWFPKWRPHQLVSDVFLTGNCLGSMHFENETLLQGSQHAGIRECF